MSIDHLITAYDSSGVVGLVPVLLGFHPQRALVVLCVGSDKMVQTTMHVELPHPALYEVQLQLLAEPIQDADIDRVIVVIVDDEQDTAELPHTELVHLASQIFTEAGVRHVYAYWTSSTEPGGSVRTYGHPAHRGTVPDVVNDHLVQNVLASTGQTVFASRDAIADLMKPDPPDVIARRNRLLSDSIGRASRSLADYLTLVHAAITSPPDRNDDHHFVQLARALCVYPVRDAVMGLCLDDDVERAEQLWLTIVRGLPAPERAEPAVLVAVTALLRGDGAWANIALDIVEHAMPHHRLGLWLRRAQLLRLSPEEIREFIRNLATEAMAEIEHT